MSLPDNPAVLTLIMDEFDTLLMQYDSLLEERPYDFCELVQRFIAYVVCRSFREGVRMAMKRMQEPTPEVRPPFFFRWPEEEGPF